MDVYISEEYVTKRRA
jgi:hypothetical protein